MKMELKNCEECGKLFMSAGALRCPECLDREEAIFSRIRDYVWEHPGVTVDDVVRELGVKPEKVLAYLREGRLAIKGLTCQRCGAPINMGRICQRCAKELEQNVNRTIKGHKAKMHTASMRREKK
ncbi:MULTISPECIES: hypothetical protein [Carboxydocella]|nr:MULTISPECIES: hypothetical protein [Carboxydocella]